MSRTQIGSATGGLKAVAENVWIFDDAPIRAVGLPLPIRMTIIRLSNGELLLHSSTRYSDSLLKDLEQFGRIRYLLAPNVGHWMFVSEWQRAVPEAVTLAARGLGEREQIRRAGLRIDRELVDGTPLEWAAEIESVLIHAPLFAEVALYHKPSRTLLLTDLVQNLDPEDLPPLARAAADLLGITKPDGKPPFYLRLLLRLGGRSVLQGAERLIGFAPERVIFAHGEWFERDGTERLGRSLRWLVPANRARPDERGAREMAGARVVITGASSGIGRAAALAFARSGATVVLAARRELVLNDVAAECEALGARALVVPTDITDASAVMRLAERAEEAFGGIDVWINNAGTGVFGPYQGADIALHRRTIEVNLLGAMHGAYAVLPVFLRQKRGTLINNISLGGWAPTPFAAAYTASKFGLRGFTSSLRQELAEHRDIHVCGVFPSMVDTPGFVHGANVSGRRLDPGPLLYEAQDVAETFLQLVRRPRDEVAVGWPARAGQISYATVPRQTERLTGAVFRWLLARARPAPRTEGTLLQPEARGVQTTGGWLARKGVPPARQISMMLAVAGVATLAIAAVAIWRSSERGRRRRITRRAPTGEGWRQRAADATARSAR